MKLDEERTRITNRQIAILLSRIEELKLSLPQIIGDEIKRAFWYLSNDLKKMYEEGEMYEGHKKE
jgi:hypothetical protein